MAEHVKWGTNSKGFTTIEMLVSSVIFSILVLGAGGTIAMYRLNYHNDVAKTRLNQNLRNATAIVSSALTQSGEYLPVTFPIIELTNGTSGSSDRITVRKGLLAEAPFLCKTLGTGAADRIYISSSAGGAPSGCVRANVTTSYNTWKSYRSAATGAQTKAYIYDSAAKVGEFFSYISEVDTGSEYYLVRTSGTWANTYNTSSTSLYIIEEIKFQRTTDTLELIINEDTSNPYYATFGITDLQVEIRKVDDTIVNSFSRSDQWQKIKYVDFTINGLESGMKKTISKSLTTSIFPRNILGQS
ncbi:prepilin-type N-terminal cleavage/methylation domain-containing protein [bacterium]|nr:prepilin-type N-terminal cleavage/methylation domain-containing protein [bacterium]